MTVQNSSEQKAAVRRQIKDQRKKISPGEKEEWDKALCKNFFQLYEKTTEQKPWLLDSPVYLYLDICGEAGSSRILDELWRRKIRTAVPRVEGQELRFYEISRREHLISGYMKILEPDVSAGLSLAERPDSLVLVPGIAFDWKGFRLGYGGGFYDRFFNREPDHLRWGLSYLFQIFQSIPHQIWDQQMDGLITPTGSFIIKRPPEKSLE